MSTPSRKSYSTDHPIQLVNDPSIGYHSFDDFGIFQLVSATRKGFSFADFQALFKKLTFSMQDWASFLHISERTLQRYKKDKKAFDSLQSERIMQIVLLQKFGTEVFGSEENYSTWLISNNVALGNCLPKSLLDNTFGIELVKNELGRIQHGVLA